jgi:hypothetical protein
LALADCATRQTDVRIEGGGFSNYGMARLAGRQALADLLEQLELEIE